MAQFHILPFLVANIVEIIIFLVIVKFIPHRKSREQICKWKVAILFSIGSLLLWQIIFLGLWLSLLISSFLNDTIQPISSVIRSLFMTILASNIIGLFFAIFIFVMEYWSLHYRPWLTYDLETGASLFDKLSEHILKIVNKFHLSG